MPGLIESVPMTSVSCDDDFGVPDTEYWCFLDESGTPDYDPDSKPYFAFGSAVFEGDHGDEYMKVLRARASRTGVQSGSMPPMTAMTPNSASSNASAAWM